MSHDDWNHYGDGLDSHPEPPAGDDGMTRRERIEIAIFLLGVAAVALFGVWLGGGL